MYTAFFGRKMPPLLLAIGALCLSTPKHNGKSGTAYIDIYFNAQDAVLE